MPRKSEKIAAIQLAMKYLSPEQQAAAPEIHQIIVETASPPTLQGTDINTIVSVDNLYNGKFMIESLRPIKIEKGIKFVGSQIVSSYGLINQITGELIYGENSGQKVYYYIITENKAKKLGYIK